MGKETFTQIIVLFLSVLGISCSQKSFDSKEELLSYIKNPENGYYQQKTINGITVSLLYRPTDLIVSQELSNNNSDVLFVDSLRKNYSKYLYFNLLFSKNRSELLNTIPSSKNEFGSMVNQLAFKMSEDVHLYTSSKDTIPLIDYVYPRMYGMSNSTSMIFIFSKESISSNTENIIFSLEDIGLSIGEVKFKTSYNKIKNQPRLNI